MDSQTEDRPGCFFCRRRAGQEDDPVLGYLHQDDHFLVGHGFQGFDSGESLLVESRRHVLDPGDMTDQEVASLSALLPRLYRAMRQGLGCERVYLLSTQAFNPHFHAWLHPWRTSDEDRGLPFLVKDRSCTEAEARRAAAAISAHFTDRAPAT